MGTPWAGPPRLLIAATVLAFAVSPVVSSAGEDAAPASAGVAARAGLELSSATGSARVRAVDDNARPPVAARAAVPAHPPRRSGWSSPGGSVW